MEKLNIAELLKDCPKGMELDCTMWDNCTYYGLEDIGYVNILIKTPCGIIKLSKEGYFSHTCSDAKCVIFPKGKTTWEGFQRPFEDGDVVVCEDDGKITQMFIFKSQTNNNKGYCYTGYNFDINEFFAAGNWHFDRLATEEEKQKLFDAIKANGYKWNPETKTLEKLIEPKFKVGDRIEKYGNRFTIAGVKDDYYLTKCGNKIPIDNQDDCSLVPNKFDITTLKPFESRVLVRGSNDDIWKPAIWGIYNDIYCSAYPYITTYGATRQCIPYEDNQHLLGTTNDCDDYFKTWE